MDGSAFPELRWTPERVAELRRMLEVERLSYTVAAEILGVTKNAVVGAAHRAGIQSAYPSKGGGWANLRPIEPRPPAPAVTGCRYIEGQPQGARTQFCGGQPHEPGSSWCADHRAIVFVRAGTADHKKLSSWLAIGPNTPGRRRA